MQPWKVGDRRDAPEMGCLSEWLGAKWGSCQLLKTLLEEERAVRPEWSHKISLHSGACKGSEGKNLIHIPIMFWGAVSARSSPVFPSGIKSCFLAKLGVRYLCHICILSSKIQTSHQGNVLLWVLHVFALLICVVGFLNYPEVCPLHPLMEW